MSICRFARVKPRALDCMPRGLRSATNSLLVCFADAAARLLLQLAAVDDTRAARDAAGRGVPRRARLAAAHEGAQAASPFCYPSTACCMHGMYALRLIAWATWKWLTYTCALCLTLHNTYLPQ